MLFSQFKWIPNSNHSHNKKPWVFWQNIIFSFKMLFLVVFSDKRMKTTWITSINFDFSDWIKRVPCDFSHIILFWIAFMSLRCHPDLLLRTNRMVLPNRCVKMIFRSLQWPIVGQKMLLSEMFSRLSYQVLHMVPSIAIPHLFINNCSKIVTKNCCLSLPNIRLCKNYTKVTRMCGRSGHSTQWTQYAVDTVE